MSIGKKIAAKIRNRVNRYFYKKKKFGTEEEFYTYLFTKNPSWSSPEPNEDESLRWNEIRTELDKANIRAARILEIGCGRGWLCNKLSAYGTVTGIEPVEPVINYAKKLFPGIDFQPGFSAGYARRFPDEKFDIIVNTEVIEHVTDKRTFMEEIRSMLKPGGIVILTTPRLEHYDDSIKAYGGDPNQPVEEWMSEQDLQQLFADTQFSVITKKFFSPLPNLDKEVMITQLWTGKKAG